MYPVTNDFLMAVQSNTRRYHWTGTITTKAGVVYDFTEKDILKGSGYIASQCCGSNEIELGTVYASEMGITLLTNIDRYSLEDAKIELFYHLLLPTNMYETVPMGIFEISEANRSIHCLQIKAYDYMLRFEKNFRGFDVIGNAYEMIALCCKACDVEFAHTQAEIESMPNGAIPLSIYTENDIETYRDVLFYIGQILGCFFYINREGKLALKKYGTNPVMEITMKQRFSSSFSDFITRYTAVSSTNMKTQIAEYYGLDEDNGLTMNLGVNPFLQFGVSETRGNICKNILVDISLIQYVPFDSDTIGNPALELGDVLKFSGGHADDTQITCITYSYCRIGGKHTIRCVGKNPKLAQAKSKNDKNISGLLSQIEAEKIGIHTFTNASIYNISDVKTKIISIEFATKEESHAQFFGQVVVDVEAEQVEKTATAKGTIVIRNTESEENFTNSEVLLGTVSKTNGDSTENVSEENKSSSLIEVELPVTWIEDGTAICYVTFELNDEEIKLHCPVETWHGGKHILSLYYPIENVMSNVTNTFCVYLRMEKGTGTIGTGDCIASISGQGMGAVATWDGKIEVEEVVSRFSLAQTVRVKSYTSVAAMETMELVNRCYTENLSSKISLGAFCRPVEVE